MAKDLTRQPWIFDAADQTYERDAASTRGLAASTSTRQKVWIRQIKLDTGDGGDFLMSDIADKRMLKLDNTPANDTLWIPIDASWEGIKITTLAANATLEVYHGKD